MGRVLPGDLLLPTGVFQTNLLRLRIPEWAEVVSSSSTRGDLKTSTSTKVIMGRRKTRSFSTTERALVEMPPEGGLSCRPPCRGREMKEAAGRGATRGVETERGAGERVNEAPWRGTEATIRLLLETAGGRAVIGTTHRSARGRVTRGMISRKLVAVAGNESANNFLPFFFWCELTLYLY